MAKFEEVFEDTMDLYKELFKERGLSNINITVLANNKAKEIYKVKKSDDLMKFRTNDDVTIILNEKIFEQLTNDQQKIVAEESIAGISYNSETDKVEIAKPDFIAYSGVLRKYGFEGIEVVRESIKSLYEKEKDEEDMAKNARTTKSKQY